MKCRFFLSVLILSLAVSCGPKDGIHTFYLCTTNDVHGRYFDSLYVGTDTKGSLLAVSRVVDSIRTACGDENVVLVDAGDCVQGDNASYYFNFVDTLSPHLYAEMANYMCYDAHVLGNHDIETGHPVYDRLRKQLKAPMLAANALRTDNRKAYFDEYAVIRRHGVRIAVIGFTNANIKNWLSPELWSGMEFERILPMAQETVDRVIEKEKPHVVIVAVHSGTGEGNGNSIENEGLDLFRTLEGVDFVVCAHDHRPAVFETDSICMINSGSHCRNIGFGHIDIETKDGKVISKALSASLIPVDKEKTDTVMRERFRPQYEAVKAFTVKPVGELDVPLVTRLSYMGMSNYINFLHTINLQCSGAQVSFAAPLDFDGHIEPGRLVYNDLFTIYPFENQLFTVRMSGKEIKDYLELSYDRWINTVSSGGRKREHLLKIENAPDLRTGSVQWSFVNRAYNFDSAAGLVYTVDITKPVGERVHITSLASGESFACDGIYEVAMTSYRASGGGGLMKYGAGIDSDALNERVVARHPDIRSMIYDYIREHGTLTDGLINEPSVIGHWCFIPEKRACEMMEADMSLVFGD